MQRHPEASPRGTRPPTEDAALVLRFREVDFLLKEELRGRKGFPPDVRRLARDEGVLLFEGDQRVQ